MIPFLVGIPCVKAETVQQTHNNGTARYKKVEFDFMILSTD
jgi:hypothetical protein